MCSTITSAHNDDMDATTAGLDDTSELHMLGFTLLATHYNTQKTNANILMSYTGTWNKTKVRILVDSGSTKFALFNSRGQNMRGGKPSKLRLLTGAGEIHKRVKIFKNQKLTVQNNTVTISNMEAIDLGGLPYDIILGMPFLKRYDPRPRWRTGALEFKKFTWFDNGIDDEIHPINASTLAYEYNTGNCDIIMLNLQPQDDQEEEIYKKIINQELSKSRQDELKEIIRKYKRSGICSEKDNLPHKREMHRPKHWAMRIPLRPDATKFPSAKSRRLSPDEEEELYRQIMFLLTHGFIKPSKSRFASPTLFARKKDGTLRWCCDFRVLNQASYHEASPLPDIQMLINKLYKARYFTALDLIQGYHQLHVHETDTWKTAITTPFGLFEWLVIPFGLSGAPGHFQSVMSELFGPLTEYRSYVVNLLDDLLIFSNTWEEHIPHIKSVLEKLNHHQFYLNLRKCFLAQYSVVYVGQKIGCGTREADPSKVQALLNLPTPKTATAIRSLLGIANYLSPYIPKYGEMVAPFTYHRSLGKRTGIHLGADHKLAIEKIKQALTKPPVLRLPDFQKKFYLQVDASKVAIGSALLQRYGDKLLPVAYRARVLNKAQKKWPIHDLELWALVDATKHFRSYVQDKPFVVLSDHKPLEHFRTQPLLNMRQLRVLDHLAMFQYEFRYIPGDKNIFADTLSRPSGHEINVQEIRPDFTSASCSLCKVAEMEVTTDEVDMGEIPGMPRKQVYKHTCGKQTGESSATLLNIVQTVEGLAEFTLKEVAQACKRKNFCRHVMDTIASTPGHHYHQKYKVYDGALYLRPVEGEMHYRLCVPDENDIREQVIKLHHDDPTTGHRDADSTYLAVREHCYWPNMRRTCQQYVRTCTSCLANKSQNKKPGGLLHPLEHPRTQPMADIATDFTPSLPQSKQFETNLVFDNIQIYVCRLSKRLRLIPCKTSDTAKTAAHNYYVHMFPIHGLPRSIVSDRDPKFTSAFWQALGKIFGVTFRMSSKHHPQTDGISENCVKVVKMLIRIFTNYAQNDWVNKLPAFEFCLNRTRVRGRVDQNNTTPFQISLGYQPYSLADLAMPTPSNTDVEDFVQQRKLAMAMAQDAIIAGQDVIAKTYNAKRRVVNYQVGDRVLIDKRHITPPHERERRSFAFRANWVGPYEILRKVGDNAIELNLPRSMSAHPVFAVDSTKPFPAKARMRTTKPVDVDGEQEYYVDRILDTRVRRKTRAWLVQWAGVDTSLLEQGDKTWEIIEAFESSQGTNIHLIEFEEERTGLTGSHEHKWDYTNGQPGQLIQQSDGYTTYFAEKSRQTLSQVAALHKVSIRDLVNQNVRKYGEGVLTPQAKLKKGQVLRLPKKVEQMHLIFKIL